MRVVTFLLSLVLLGGLPVDTAAQAAASGRLRVVVFDPSGAVIPGALVKVRGAEDKNRGVTRADLPTDQQGAVIVDGLPAGRYDIEVAFAGFQGATVTGLRVRAGATAQREVTLAIEKVDESVAVGRDPATNASDPNNGRFDTVLAKDQIDALPDDPDEMQKVLEDMAGPGAVIRVDGFRGGRLPPKAQIRSIRFSRDPFAAEHHGGGMIHVDIVTQPGMGPLSGGADMTFRDAALNARNAFQAEKGDERTQRYGLNLSGTIKAQTTSFSLWANGASAFDPANVFANTLDGRVTGVARQGNESVAINARVDHALNAAHTLRANVMVNDTEVTTGVGDFNLFERGVTTSNQNATLRLSDNGSWGKSFFNETRLQLVRGSSDLTPAMEAQTIEVLDSFVGGGGQRRGGRDTTSMELASNVDYAKGRHAVRFGFLLESGWYDSDTETNYLGRFTFANLDDYAAARPMTYSQRTGDPRVEYSQWQLGFFAQDDWRAAQNLTISFGVRQEMQANLDDALNVSPRVGVTWSPFKGGKTTVRTSFGLFHDWLESSVYEQSLQVDGIRMQEIVVRNPGYPDYLAGGATQVVLPASRYTLADDLTMPYSVRASVGVQHQLPRNFGANVLYAFSRGYDRFRGRNINAPDPSRGGLRPDPSFGNITQVESTGGERRHMVHGGLSYMLPARRTFVFANYTLNHTENDSAGAFGLPADSYNLDAEWGPAGMLPRHTLNMNLSTVAFKRLSVGVNGFVRSGAPYNITTGRDDNGDTVFNDRPAGVSRNSARAKATYDLGGRLTYAIGFGRRAGEGGAPGAPTQITVRSGGDGGGHMMMGGGAAGTENSRYRVEFFVAASNLLNTVNPTGYSGVMTSELFGQPTGALAARRIDLGARFGF
ncbi:MAG: TonB-dependent receptor [Acidobacteriota bacterium]|nr:TonB-dependent receptor [Acidobacteriota bacterium]